MTFKEYYEYRKRYVVCIDAEAFQFALRKHAFDELDAQIEMYYENDWGNEMNDGESIIEALTPQAIEEIIDDYLTRFDEEGQYFRDRMIKNAIQDVTGLIC